MANIRIEEEGFDFLNEGPSYLAIVALSFGYDSYL